jgi:hypothetical protein
MDTLLVPAPLRNRLGEDASEGMVQMFAAYREFSTDHFERRLTETVGGLRLEMHQGIAAIRQDMSRMETRFLRWTLGIWMAQLAFETSIILGVAAYFLRAP